jgi:hypothetical protein
LNLISITTPPLAVLIDRHGYELDAILQVMQRLKDESLVDGFEFQNLAEWDTSGPPRDKAAFEVRIRNWSNCEKHSIDEIAYMLKQSNLPILSVHANRDVGICLCSNKQRDVLRGEELIRDSFNLAHQVEAKICVFHLWDTWKKHFDLMRLKRVLDSIADDYSGIRAAVENVPINLENTTPYDAVKKFDWITLDLRWAAMYNEFDKFKTVEQKIVNIHLRGRLEVNQWVIHHAPFTFSNALDLIRNDWKYTGLLTLEPEGGLKNTQWTDFAQAVERIRY